MKRGRKSLYRLEPNGFPPDFWFYFRCKAYREAGRYDWEPSFIEEMVDRHLQKAPKQWEGNEIAAMVDFWTIHLPSKGAAVQMVQACSKVFMGRAMSKEAVLRAHSRNKADPAVIRERRAAARSATPERKEEIENLISFTRQLLALVGK